MAEKYSSKDLQKWLFEKALSAAAPKARQLLIRNDQRGRDSALIGSLYFFKYDPKLKAKLEMYDKFPMAFPIKMYKDGFLGVNMHYLPMGERKEFIERVNKYRSTSDDNRVAINAQLIQMLESSKRIYKMMPEAVHRYLYSHARSKFITILPDEYEKAVQLRIDEWVFKG